MHDLKFVGPFRLRDYINDLLAIRIPNPLPIRPGVYIVTEQPWTGWPSPGQVLYVGGTDKLLERVADLIIDLLGFFDGGDGRPWVGHHTGGQSCWRYCNDNHKQVGELFIAW